MHTALRHLPLLVDNYHYDDNAIANLLFFARLADDYYILCNTRIDDAIYVQSKEDGKFLRFRRCPRYNIYYMDIGEGKPDGHCYVFISVRNNQRNFSILDQKRPEVCRLLQEKCGFPSDTDFINAIENSKIPNIDFGRRDVKIANEIYGYRAGAAMGKMKYPKKGHKMERVTEDTISPVPSNVFENYKSNHLDIDLLFIYSKKNKNIKIFISKLNNALWDIGLEIGISFLTINEALKDSKKEFKTLTKFLESRYLLGNRELYNEYLRNIKILTGRLHPLKLSKQKLQELFIRHNNALGTKSTLEPNIKEGVGCLRDIHTILWISNFLFDVRKVDELESLNILSSTEIRELKRSWEFLITVRSLNHFFNQSKGDIISIENQLKIAKHLKYKDVNFKSRKKEMGVEKFMKDLFLHITKISEILNLFYSKLPEELIISTIFQQGSKIKSYKSKNFKITKGFLEFKKYDLIGIPYQIIIGSKSEKDKFEFKELNSQSEILNLDKITSAPISKTKI